MRKYRLSKLMKEIEKDEKVRENDMGKKMSQAQIRKMLSSLRKKESGTHEK